ncbi:MAG: hypothetical protein QGG63_02080 [Candidatus Pacebacteria bacterium]|jgi:hypothetical protein|nr:hypothetical protein [Candidatus Paceibacterota bacterium]|tara:strand:+ start:1682 stop:2203 length:522 start_codon:yes stop_codon:yes gene_type:complete
MADRTRIISDTIRERAQKYFRLAIKLGSIITLLIIVAVIAGPSIKSGKKSGRKVDSFKHKQYILQDTGKESSYVQTQEEVIKSYGDILEHLKPHIPTKRYTFSLKDGCRIKVRRSDPSIPVTLSVILPNGTEKTVAMRSASEGGPERFPDFKSFSMKSEEAVSVWINVKPLLK